MIGHACSHKWQRYQEIVKILEWFGIQVRNQQGIWMHLRFDGNTLQPTNSMFLYKVSLSRSLSASARPSHSGISLRTSLPREAGEMWQPPLLWQRLTCTARSAISVALTSCPHSSCLVPSLLFFRLVVYVHGCTFLIHWDGLSISNLSTIIFQTVTSITHGFDMALIVLVGAGDSKSWVISCFFSNQMFKLFQIYWKFSNFCKIYVKSHSSMFLYVFNCHGT